MSRCCGVLWLAIVMGCGGSAPTTTLRVGQPLELLPMNPAVGSDGFSDAGNYLVFDSLVEPNGRLGAKPRLLERWIVSGGGRNIRLVLRSGVRFQDGHPLTSDDLLYTLDEMRRPENGSYYARDLEPIAQIIKVDDRTVDLVLSEPRPRLYESLTFGVLPRHLLTGQTLPGNQFGWHPIGAGPYRVVSMSPTRMELVAFDGYYGGRPAMERMSVVTYRPDELWRQILVGNIDLALDLPWYRREFLARMTRFRVDESTRQAGMALWLNTHRAPFDDPANRRAVTAAIDRAQMIDRVHHSFGLPSDRLDPRASFALRVESEPARRRMAGKTITLAVVDTDANFSDAALELQRQLAVVGVSVRIVPLSITQMQRDNWVDHADAYLTRLGNPEPLEDIVYLLHASERRGIRSREVDETIAKLRASDDDTQRAALFQRVESILADEGTFSVLYWQPLLSAYRSDLCGFHMTTPFRGLDRITPCPK